MLLLVGVELAAFRIIVFRHGGGDWASFATVHLPFSPENPPQWRCLFMRW